LERCFNPLGAFQPIPAVPAAERANPDTLRMRSIAPGSFEIPTLRDRRVRGPRARRRDASCLHRARRGRRATPSSRAMTDVPIVPAATVVLLRDRGDAPEVLLLQRSSKLAFHGGAWVFPGGRFDLELGETPDDAGARLAAVREAREEAGVALDPASLVPLSHWTTPEGQPRRFATWFFVARLAAGDVVVDGGEIHDHRWCTAADALIAQRKKEIELPPPTFVTLSVLAAHATAESMLAAAATEPPLVYLPRIVRGASGAASLYPGDAGWESRDLDRSGSRHRLMFLEAGWKYVRDR
jgi:8-oxo-dGTP pyrophosphatase MutT (NUDIX family)